MCRFSACRLGNSEKCLHPQNQFPIQKIYSLPQKVPCIPCQPILSPPPQVLFPLFCKLLLFVFEFHIHQIIQHLLFVSGLKKKLLFTIMFLKFIHVIESIWSSFFLLQSSIWLQEHATLCFPLFPYLFVGGYVGCFLSAAFTDNLADIFSCASVFLKICRERVLFQMCVCLFIIQFCWVLNSAGMATCWIQTSGTFVPCLEPCVQDVSVLICN